MEGPEPTGQDQGVDVGAMIARMRRLREEREREQARTLPRPTAQPAGTDRVILRFQPGQRVRCVPYGEGVVRQSRLVGGREQLTVEFPDHGAIEVDPAVSAVRLLDPLMRERPEPDGELL